MLDINFIRNNKELVMSNCKNRRVSIDIDALLVLDEKRRVSMKAIDELRAERNKNSKGKPNPEEIAAMRSVGQHIKILETELADIEKEFYDVMMKVPNMTHPDVPIGGENDFTVTYKNKEPEVFLFEPKDHETLLTNNGFIDFERGAKVAASKFYFSQEDLVRLNFALIQYGIDVVSKYHYRLIETPDVAKNNILHGTGYNPRGNETQIYSIENTDLSLIATAEIAMGGYHANEILDLSRGPVKYAALSHCFRTEAGGYGRTSKGLYRVHQFTKLEMFIYCRPEESEEMHAELLRIEKEIIDGLEIPYRVIDIASGDLGGPAYRKFDIEAWMTMNAGEGSQGGYGEITSTSNCTDYQARRLHIRHRKEDGSLEFVHTLNGTAVVLSRFPIAIIENYQMADGRIVVPKILQKYMGKEVMGT